MIMRHKLQKKANIAPIATYRHTSNLEVVVVAVDTVTGVFTSVGHGLVNGNTIAPTINNGTLGLPATIYPSGITNLNMPSMYFVIESTNDTFKVSLTNGGVAVIPTTSGDLSKFHFERTSVTNIIISNLFESDFHRLVIKGKSLVNGAQTYITPQSVTTGNFGIKGDLYAGLFLLGTVYSYALVTINGLDRLVINYMKK